MLLNTVLVHVILGQLLLLYSVLKGGRGKCKCYYIPSIQKLFIGTGLKEKLRWRACGVRRVRGVDICHSPLISILPRHNIIIPLTTQRYRHTSAAQQENRNPEGAATPQKSLYYGVKYQLLSRPIVSFKRNC